MESLKKERKVLGQMGQEGKESFQATLTMQRNMPKQASQVQYFILLRCHDSTSKSVHKTNKNIKLKINLQIHKIDKTTKHNGCRL